MADWRSARARLGDVQQRMLEVLDQLGLRELVCSIDGLSGVGAAAILAETGDMTRFASARSVVLEVRRIPATRQPCDARWGTVALRHPGSRPPQILQRS
jgi:transposase